MGEYLTFEELTEAEGVEAEDNISYIPSPNVVDVVISEFLAVDELTPTSFAFAFFDNGDVLLANNRRRQIEVPGGHRDRLPSGVLEHPVAGAKREVLEETGAEVDKLWPVGFMRARSSGEIPEAYRYPFPISCQQFFAGRIVSIQDFVETDECRSPVRLTHEEALERLKGRTLALYQAARDITFPSPASTAAPAL